jgi:NAD(P)-dependent dehydrogenase (short-subunit alcohol dehydrogenase family)
MVAGKAALVTGASRGIGFGIARELLRHGARVCITARHEVQLDAALADLDAGDDAIAVAGRSDDPAHRTEALTTMLERFGAIDLLVNNAAVNPVYGPIVETEPGVGEKVMGVNVLAPLAWVGQAWELWMREHGGVVLNIASVGGVRPAHGLGLYNTSKAALIHLTRQLALELAPGVRVNALAPAVVKTKFARVLYEGKETAVAAGYPLGRLGTTEDTAAAARYLLSEESSWVTGQTLVLDGGVTLSGWKEA